MRTTGVSAGADTVMAVESGQEVQHPAAQFDIAIAQVSANRDKGAPPLPEVGERQRADEDQAINKKQLAGGFVHLWRQGLPPDEEMCCEGRRDLPADMQTGDQVEAQAGIESVLATAGAVGGQLNSTHQLPMSPQDPPSAEGRRVDETPPKNPVKQRDPHQRLSAQALLTPLDIAPFDRAHNMLQAPSTSMPPTSAMNVELPSVKVIHQEAHLSPAHLKLQKPLIDDVLGGKDSRVRQCAQSGKRALERATGPEGSLEQRAAVEPSAATGPDEVAGEPAPTSGAAQVADSILAHIENEGGKLRQAPMRAQQSDERPSIMPFQRLIRLQVMPQSLGLINVVIAGGEGSLRVRLEAEQSSTAGNLEVDRRVIEQRLALSGVNVDDLFIGKLDTRSFTSDQSDAASGQSSGAPAGDNEAAQRGGGRQRPPVERPGHEEELQTGREPDYGDRKTVPTQLAGDRFLGQRNLRTI